MAELFTWFMQSWWSTALACVCVLVLFVVALCKVGEVERLKDKKNTPTLREALLERRYRR